MQRQGSQQIWWQQWKLLHLPFIFSETPCVHAPATKLAATEVKTSSIFWSLQSAWSRQSHLPTIYVCTAKTKQNQKNNLTLEWEWSPAAPLLHNPFGVSWQRRIWCECSLTLPLQAALKIAQPNQCIFNFSCTSCYQIIFPLVYFSILLQRGKEDVCCDCQLLFCVFVIKITVELCNSFTVFVFVVSSLVHTATVNILTPS